MGGCCLFHHGVCSAEIPRENGTQFADLLSAHLWQHRVSGVAHTVRMADDDLPLPIVESTDQEALTEAFGSPDAEPDPYTPRGTAFLWWQALQDPVHYRNALDNLSTNPSAWNGYRQAADLIADLSMLTGVEDNEEDPDIKYVRFIHYEGASSGQVFEDAEMRDFFVLTVVKPEESDWWLVWGLSDSYFPSRDEVRDL